MSQDVMAFKMAPNCIFAKKPSLELSVSHQFHFSILLYLFSASPTKLSNTLKKFVGKTRRIV